MIVSGYLYYVSESLKRKLYNETVNKIKITANSVKSEVKINILLSDTLGLKVIGSDIKRLDKNIQSVTFFDHSGTLLLDKINKDLNSVKTWDFIMNKNLLLATCSYSQIIDNQFSIQINYNLQSNIDYVYYLRLKAIIFIFFLMILLNIILFKMFYTLENEVVESEKNKQIAELAHAKEKNQRLFLANMSHEIRTPLSGIMGLLSLVKKTKLTEKQKKYLSAIDTSSKTLLTVINDILDLAKIEQGEVTLIESPFNIKNTINQIYDLFSGKCINKKLKFTNTFNSSIPPMVIGDQARINQIIYNIVGNAIKFTPTGSINLCTEFEYINNKKGIFRLYIEDTGIGIPKEKLKEIFSPFKQVEGYEERKFEGTGLGLSISQKMISLMNGQIWVTSEVGKGSLFTITIPFNLSSYNPVMEQQKELNSNLKNVNILLAEDNPINQLMAKEMLSQEKATITTVENGQEALNILKERNFDIILMDMQMPIMSGYEAMSAIRKNTHTSKYKIIALTAHVNETELKRCLDAGADRYVSKPFEIEDLKKQIIELLANKN